MRRKASRRTSGRYYVTDSDLDPAGPFSTREEAVAHVLDTYSPDNVQHVTPASPDEMNLENVGPNEWEVTGTWIGDEPRVVRVLGAAELLGLRLIVTPPEDSLTEDQVLELLRATFTDEPA